MKTGIRTRMSFAPAKFIAILGVFGLAAAAHATVVWNESVNGNLGEVFDFNDPYPGDPGANRNQTWTDLGALTTGTSTVLGSTTTTGNGIIGFTHTGDAIRFSIAAGQTITGLTITVLNPSGGSLGIRQLFLLNGAGDNIATSYVTRSFPPAQPTLDGSNTADLLVQYHSSLPFNPGAYVLSYENRANAGTLNYQVDITVIPAPAAGSLALVGLGMISRRRR